MNEIGSSRARYNTLVDKIKEAKNEVVRHLYNIGIYLWEIKRKNLFTVEFDAFTTFLEKKVEIPRGTAFDAIKIAQQFSLVEWNRYGYKRCQLLLKVDKAERSTVLDGTKTTRELAEKVSDYATEQGIKTTESTLNSIKPDKKPHTKVKEENLYKLRRDLLNLIDAMNQHKVNKDNILARYQIIKENCSKHQDFYDMKDRLAEANKLKDEI